MKTDIHTIEAEKAGSLELAEHIFGLDPRSDIIHRVVQWQLIRPPLHSFASKCLAWD